MEVILAVILVVFDVVIAIAVVTVVVVVVEVAVYEIGAVIGKTHIRSANHWIFNWKFHAVIFTFTKNKQRYYTSVFTLNPCLL